MGSSYNERTVGYQELWILGGKMQRLKTPSGYRYVVRLEFVMKLLRDDPCGLYIVAQASDFSGSGLRGVMKYGRMVLDRKEIDSQGNPSYVYGSLTGGSIANVLTFDHKPWAGEGGWYDNLPIAQRELAEWPHNEPPIPDYLKCYGEPQQCYLWHDWCPEETTIKVWDLTALLKLYPDTVDVRVRITDSTADKRDPNSVPPGTLTGYAGNWRRSGNVLEQLCCGWGGERSGQSGGIGDYPRLKVKFIDDNPYDNENTNYTKYKIVNYAGDTTADETSFIYRRNANGEAKLNLWLLYYRPLKYPFIPDHLLVNFISSELNLPGDLKNYVKDVKAELIYDDKQIYEDSNPHPEVLRLNHLFEVNTENPEAHEMVCCYYHIELTVTDDANSDSEEKILFVSSRDHLLEEKGGFEARLDFAQSIAPDGQADKLSAFEEYGKRRGLGHNNPNPDPNNKRWYGYSEYIINAGFEVVYVDHRDSGPGGDPPGLPPIVAVYENESKYLSCLLKEGIYPAVPVQSAADLVVIHGHGAEELYHAQDRPPVAGIDWYPSRENEPDYPPYRPNYEDIPNKNKWNANMERFHATNLKGCYNDVLHINKGNESAPRYQVCSDFAVTDTNKWASKAGIWWKQHTSNQETRWLALVSCTNLSNVGTSTTRPDRNWAKIVQEGYVSSVVGFSEVIQSHYYHDYTGHAYNLDFMLDEYASNLYDHVLHCNSYTPPEYVLDDFWCPPADENIDPNIAAWMEAAYSSLMLSISPKVMIDKIKVSSAAAVNATEKWFILGARKFARSGDCVDMYIIKDPL